MNAKRLRAAFLAAASSLAIGSAADEGTTSLRFSGEANADAAYGIVNPFETDPSVPRQGAYLGAASIRLDAVGGYRDSAKAEASVVTRLSYPADNPKPTLDVRKLYLSVYTEYADISAGRMIINYGKGLVFSPVDLFSSVELSDQGWTRIGTDAARVLVPFGDVSGLDLTATVADTPENATAGGRLYGNFGGWDVAFSAFRDKSAFFGLDVKGDALVGVSTEAVARVEENGTRCRFMAGLDYSLGGEWFLNVEYLENVDFGKVAAKDRFSLAHNAFASVTWVPDKISSVDVRALASLDGGSFSCLATASVTRSIVRGAALILYVRYSSGDVEGAGTAAASVPSLAAGTRLSVSF